MERAARIVGMSVSEFIIMHAEIRAEILVRRTERAEGETFPPR
jgi:uncharacterized protein (DUF1778 family)